jgi:hypothetical protein
MQYIIAGISVTLCIVVIVFGLRVLRESREMTPQKPMEQDEEEELHRLRP